MSEGAAIRDAFVALLVVSVTLSVGLDLDLSQVRRVLRRPAALLAALGYEHIAMPLVAFGIATALGAPAAGLLAVVLCAAAPGGPVGPAFVLNARGDIAFSVTLIIAAALLNVVMTPLAVSVLAPGAEVDNVAGHLVRTIALFQLLPLGVAIALRIRRPGLAKRLQVVAEWATKVVIGLLIVGMTIAQWETLLAIELHTLATIVATCVASVVGGYLLALGGRARRSALSLTAGVRNLGLALLVASSAFDEETVLAVMVYGLVMLLVVAPASAALRRRGASSG